MKAVKVLGIAIGVNLGAWHGASPINWGIAHSG